MYMPWLGVIDGSKGVEWEAGPKNIRGRHGQKKIQPMARRCNIL
jgi:hypothetical protein